MLHNKLMSEKLWKFAEQKPLEHMKILCLTNHNILQSLMLLLF